MVHCKWLANMCACIQLHLNNWCAHTPAVHANGVCAHMPPTALTSEDAHTQACQPYPWLGCKPLTVQRLGTLDLYHLVYLFSLNKFG